MDTNTFSLVNQFDQTQDDYQRSKLQQQIGQYATQLDSIQSTVIQCLSQEECDPRHTKQISDLYVELQERFEDFQHKIAPQQTTVPFQNPHMTLLNEKHLVQNLDQLRAQLRSIDQAVTLCDEVVQPVDPEQQQTHQQSLQAVQRFKNQTRVDTHIAAQELDQMQRQLAATVKENAELRGSCAALQHEIDALGMDNTQNALQAKRLFEERLNARDDFEQLGAEQERLRAKLNTAVSRYEQELKGSSAFKQEQSQRLEQLLKEIGMVAGSNEGLQKAIKQMEACDVDSAAIEVARATQTIMQLNAVVEDLKKKLVEQRMIDSRKIEMLKDTVAENVSRIAMSRVEQEAEKTEKYKGFGANGSLNTLQLIQPGQEISRQREEFDIASILKRK